MMTARRSTTADAMLLVVDVQDKLLAKIPNATAVVNSVAFLLDVARVLDVPCVATEQYPKGLGSSAAAVSDRLLQPAVPKTSFSCCGTTAVWDRIRSTGKRDLVLTGIEAHVCVAQTALDLIEAGYHVTLPVDAIASRHKLDYEVAVRRLERAGAIVSTAEAVAFEWIADAADPKFKMVSRLVIDRPRG